jgi:asparagine synthase (glutamine-hydrolysing)
MTSESGRYSVTYNGEIYNFHDLRHQLHATGWRNRSDSDTEVMLEAIERWGLDGFVDRADGMFAFGLIDSRSQRLSLVRDRFGEKPLVYSHNANRVVFASEIRSLEKISDLDLRIDPGSLADYFRFGCIPGPRTIFHDVFEVPPGSIVEFDLTQVAPAQCRSYWVPPDWDETRRRSGVDLDELEILLRRSVRNRLVSDRPIGAFLSGGIDSSLTCALAAAELSTPLQTYTMGWEDAEYDESEQALRVARALGTDHHHVKLSRTDVVKEVRSLATVMDEPFADSSLLATRLVSSAARKSLVVALSGDGGDELFAGYNRHRWLMNIQRMHERIPRTLRRPLSSALTNLSPFTARASRLVPVSRRPRLVGDKTRKFAKALGSISSTDAYQQVIALEPNIGMKRGLNPAIESALDSGNQDHMLWGLRVADLTGYLPDDILTKVDRASMSVSLETRTPFLNREIAEFALGLGASDLIGPDGGKQPLRHLLARVLPGVDFSQPKTGFGIPVGDFLRHEMSEDLGDAVAAFAQRDFGLSVRFNEEYGQFLDGDQSRTDAMWSVLMFEYWMSSRK